VLWCLGIYPIESMNCRYGLCIDDDRGVNSVGYLPRYSGAGFIGSNIVLGLLSRGEQVRVIDNFATGHEHNLQAVTEKIELHTADVTDLEAIRPAFDGADYVLHQAALPSSRGQSMTPWLPITPMLTGPSMC